ncbi:MAG: hypothetical protein ACJ79R_14895 [Anaeromyxobacteraceae bacterium]
MRIASILSGSSSPSPSRTSATRHTLFEVSRSFSGRSTVKSDTRKSSYFSASSRSLARSLSRSAAVMFCHSASRATRASRTLGAW